jgi:hypothetical protein
LTIGGNCTLAAAVSGNTNGIAYGNPVTLIAGLASLSSTTLPIGYTAIDAV